MSDSETKNEHHSDSKANGLSHGMAGYKPTYFKYILLNKLVLFSMTDYKRQLVKIDRDMSGIVAGHYGNRSVKKLS